MQRQSTILFSGLAGLTTLLASLPAIAFTAFDAGGTNNIPGFGSQTFNLNINNTTGSPVSVSNVTLNIASLVAGADLSNIELYLQSPDGTGTCTDGPPCILTLKSLGVNAGSTNYSNITFTDAALTNITFASDPITGPYQADGLIDDVVTSLPSNISDFAGFQSVVLAPGNNTWQLTAFNFDTDPASINGITLNVTPVPLEADALPILLSSGFLGAGVWVKRRLKGRKD